MITVNELSNDYWNYIYNHPNFTGCVVDAMGDRAYYLNGKQHREDGLPAYEGANGYKAYYLNGKCHREDGPAIEFADGCKEYWLYGKLYNYEEWKHRVTYMKLKMIVDDLNLDDDDVDLTVKSV